MKENRIRAVSCCLYALCAVSLLVFLYIDFFTTDLSRAFKIAITASVFILAYLGSLVRARHSNRQKSLNIMYNTFFFLFTVYIVVVIDFTLIDGTFGRDISVLFTKDLKTRADYIKTGVNLVPFDTVKLFINGYKNGVLSFADITDNLFGNLFVLAPLSFFVPVFIKRINRFYKYFLLILACVLVIEILQVLFMTGAADIDDVILNISGALIIYGILRIKNVSKFLNKATFGLWEGKNESQSQDKLDP